MYQGGSLWARAVQASDEARAHLDQVARGGPPRCSRCGANSWRRRWWSRRQPLRCRSCGLVVEVRGKRTSGGTDYGNGPLGSG